MTFEEFWQEVAKTNLLPNVAILEIPSVLSCEVKKQLTTYSPEAAAKLLVETIEDINRGNVTKLDELLKKKLAMK